MKFTNTQVMNFDNALRGMRNPKESWHKSDSWSGIISVEKYPKMLHNIAILWAQYKQTKSKQDFDTVVDWLEKQSTLYNQGESKYVIYIGPQDMDLAQRLIRAGGVHRKFMRQIFVSVDITAPLYFWKEFDTYKVGTVANSTSTMHKLASTPITLDCFETDDMEDMPIIDNDDMFKSISTKTMSATLIHYLEVLRQKYNETKDIRYWKELIRWLPESWLQTRTVTMNYENLFAMCSADQRRNHKLTEWRNSFIAWARSLPYAQELLFLDEISTKKE